MECWAPRPGLLANLSTMYACANPSCHKLWDPAVELGEARWLTSLHVNVALGCLVFGICGWVAWAQVLWDCFCGKDDDDDKKKKGVSAKLRRLRTSSRRTEQRVTRAVTRARTRKPPAEPQVVQATVVGGNGEPTAPVKVTVRSRKKKPAAEINVDPAAAELADDKEVVNEEDVEVRYGP